MYLNYQLFKNIRMGYKPILPLLVLAVGLVSVDAKAVKPVGQKPDLFTGTDVSDFYDNSIFAHGSGKARINLQGTIEITGGLDSAIGVRRGRRLLWVDSDPATAYPQPFLNGPSSTSLRLMLPAFKFDFIKNASDEIVPLKRGYIENGADLPTRNQPTTPPYEYILSPGDCWKLNNNYDQCVIVFAITEKGQNCVYNGTATFAVNVNDNTTSQMWYQVTNGFCGYLQFDLWGYADVSYTPKNLGQAGTDALNRWASEKASRINYIGLDKLASENVDVSKFQDPAYYDVCSPVDPYRYPITFSEVYFNDKPYRGVAGTRAGPHPRPDNFILPSYSWDKSITSMIVGTLDTKGCTYPATAATPSTSGTSCILDLKVGDWVAGAPSSWSNVTVQDLIDEAAGHYNSTIYGVDEGELNKNINFFYNDQYTHAGPTGKLTFSLNYFTDHTTDPRPWPFVYHTSDTYIAATLLQAVTQKVFGKTLIAYTKEKLCDPLQLSSTFCSPRVSYDSDKQPFGGFGRFAYPDDNTKIARFLGFSTGKVGGTQVISESFFKKMLQMDPNNRGNLTNRTWKVGPAGNCFTAGSTGRTTIPAQRYHNGFWSHDTINALGECQLQNSCTNKKMVFMSGYGGLRMMITHGKWVYSMYNDNYMFYDLPVTGELGCKLGCSKDYVDDGTP